MKKLNPKNVYCGAVVNKGMEELVVYKVNTKSVYAGKVPYFEFLFKWDNRKSGVTQKKFFSSIGANIYSYNDLSITTASLEKKSKFDYINEHRQEQDTILSDKERQEMRAVFQEFCNKKGYRTPRHFGAKMVVAVLCNPNGFMLLRVEENWVFWDSKLNLFFPFQKEIHKRGKEVIWPEKINMEDMA
jgi:hypothetical protein